MSDTVLSDDEAGAIREAIAAAVIDIPQQLRAQLESDPAPAALRLVDAARVASEESTQLLRAAVDGARTAGRSWDEIGRMLGVSRQAAQQRFGTKAAPGSSELSTTRRLLSPVTAFDEMAALAEAGRHGWHSVAYGTLYHLLESSEVQWEHRRVIWGAGPRRDALRDEGWQLIGSLTFPWSYWARPLDAAAEPEAG